jgi:hypothetical protein
VAFEKGHPKYGGMKKGYKHKSKALAEELDVKGISVLENILAEMPNLEPYQKVQTWLKIMDYVYVKTSALQVTGEDGAPVLTLAYALQDTKDTKPKDTDEATAG